MHQNCMLQIGELSFGTLRSVSLRLVHVSLRLFGFVSRRALVPLHILCSSSFLSLLLIVIRLSWLRNRKSISVLNGSRPKDLPHLSLAMIGEIWLHEDAQLSQMAQ
jgi:hypothetical protein